MKMDTFYRLVNGLDGARVIRVYGCVVPIGWHLHLAPMLFYLYHPNRGIMFTPLGLWKRTICPEKGMCARVPCPFSHESSTDAPQTPVALLSTLVRPALEK